MSEETTTLIDNLNSIKDSKLDIKQALIDKGQPATDVFSTYANLIGDIETGIDTSDATATASDIKEGKTAYVDGEKITGIYVDEDLTDVLDAQDQKIAELEHSLENKTAGGGKPNIFVQLEEPEEKNGIWLQTDKTLEHIYADDDIFIAGEWKPDEAYKNIPYNFYRGSAVVVSTNIYLFGSYSSSYQNYAYKYDTLTNTYTKLKNTPYVCFSGSAVVVGTDVYLFGSGSGSGSYSTYAYKYDTLTNTYTQLTNIPYQFSYGQTVNIGTDIYLFGSGSYPTYAYKYDTLTNTYTQLTNIPYQLYKGSAVAIDTDIYLFGGGNSSYSTYAYKYDTLTDTYTKLTNIPYQFMSGSAVVVGTDIYLFGGNGSSSAYTYAYKYNTLTNTYTQVTNIPNQFYEGSAVVVGTDIYLFGGAANTQKVQVYVLESSTYENNSVVIAQGRYYQTGYGIELYNDNLFSSPMLYAFADAWFYTTEDGIITTIPTYYGDGTQWIKFKN